MIFTESLNQLAAVTQIATASQKKAEILTTVVLKNKTKSQDPEITI